MLVEVTGERMKGRGTADREGGRGNEEKESKIRIGMAKRKGKDKIR